MSIYCSWKNFCARYFHNWCKSNAPCGLLVESTAGSVGLIRKSSVSLFRCSEDIERFLDGMSVILLLSEVGVILCIFASGLVVSYLSYFFEHISKFIFLMFIF